MLSHLCTAFRPMSDICCAPSAYHTGTGKASGELIGSSCSDVGAVALLVSVRTRDDTLELQQNFIFAQMLQGENASRLDSAFGGFRKHERKGTSC